MIESCRDNDIVAGGKFNYCKTSSVMCSVVNIFDGQIIHLLLFMVISIMNIEQFGGLFLIVKTILNLLTRKHSY